MSWLYLHVFVFQHYLYEQFVFTCICISALPVWTVCIYLYFSTTCMSWLYLFVFQHYLYELIVFICISALPVWADCIYLYFSTTCMIWLYLFVFQHYLYELIVFICISALPVWADNKHLGTKQLFLPATPVSTVPCPNWFQTTGSYVIAHLFTQNYVEISNLPSKYGVFHKIYIRVIKNWIAFVIEFYSFFCV